MHARGQGTLLAGRFRLIERIAAGGMGTVHRALDEITGRDVAVKLLAPSSAAGEMTERFRREATILAGLEHPSVVSFVDFGSEEGGGLYLAMEWLQGVDLLDKLRGGVLGVADTIRVARHVAEALSAAHELGIVHRDVKPANIFLVGGNLSDIKVLDFGIALLTGRSTGITRTGMTIGTPEYMPPEQARGERTMDGRVDVYALGCVIFQCLTGKPPFFGPTPASVIAEVLLAEAPRLSTRAPQAPPELDALVAAMLQKDPKDRPGSAREVADALSAIESRLGPIDDPARPAVSTDERRLASVVGVAPSVATTSAEGATQGMPAAFHASTGAVVSVAERHQGAVTMLPGRGALIVFVADSPVQAALSAARAAMELVRLDRELQVGLTAGQASLRAGPERALVDRALAIAAVPGEVRIDDAARSLIGGALDVEMTAAGPVVRGERRVEQTGTRAFIGREREIGSLTSALDAVLGDRAAQVVMVTGPPGLGKSRLVRELHDRTRAAPQPPAVLDARAEELRRNTPFAALGSLLRRGIGIAESATPNEQRAHLQSAVAAWIDPASAARVADFLGIAVGLDPEKGSVELAAALRDPQLMDDQIERATIELLSALIERFGGLAIILDDAHFADIATLKLFARAHRRLGESALFIALFGRPELEDVVPAGLREAASQRIQLAGLARRAAERLVAEVLGGRAGPATVERIVTHADGNPLFLQELCAAHTEGRAPAEVPATVLASVEARLLRFEPAARKILRAASVFGEAFWRGGLGALLGPDAAETTQLGDWLVHLVDRGVFVPRRETRFAGEPELVFRHPLLREAAYAMLPPADRREAHRRAVEWLTEAGERDPAVLAEHHAAADDGAAAARSFLDAAHLSLVRNDLTRAVQHAERAIEGGLDDADRARAHTIACEALLWLGEPERGADHGRRAAALHPPDSQGRVDATAALVRCLGRTGGSDAIDLSRELVRAVRADSSLVVSPAALPVVVSTALRAGLHALAGDVLDVFGQSALARAGDPVARAHVLTSRSWQAMFDGDYAACVNYDSEVLRCMKEAGDLRQACLAQVHVGYDYLILGAYDRAVVELSAAQQEAERWALETVEQLAKHNLSLALHRLGESDRGLEMQRECLAYALHRRNQLEEGHARHYLAIILFERGEHQAARVELERVLANMPTSALRWETLARLAAILMANGDLEEAQFRIDEAVLGLEQLRNAEEGDGYVRLVAVLVRRAMGDENGANALLVAARNRILWRAGRIADPALRRSFMRAIPEHANTLELAEQLASAGRNR